MAWVILDVAASSPSFVQTVTLDGTAYELQFTWNVRGGWFMAMRAGSQTLFAPRRVVADRDLLASVRDNELCPPGMLVAMDTSGDQRPPGYADFRGGVGSTGRVVLAYKAA